MKKQGKIFGRPLERPVPNISLGQFLLEKLRANRDRVLLINSCNGQHTTNQDLLEKSVQLAEFLKAYGIKLGDRIGIVSENRPDWAIPVYASIFIGAVITPYNPAYTEWEFQNILNIAKPRLIFLSRRTEELFVKLLPSLTWPITLIELDDQPFTANIRTLPDILRNSKFTNFQNYRTVDIGDNAKHPVAILCSSGTTGLPKGVTLSHKNFISFTIEVSKPNFLNVKSNDRFLMFLPFYHGYAFSMLFMLTYNGCNGIVMPNFEPDQFLNLMSKYKVNRLAVVPTILTFLAKYPPVKDYDFSNMREVICGAAPMQKYIAKEVQKLLGINHIANGYGMTELTVISHLSDPMDQNDIGMRRLVHGMFCKIIDPETRETLDIGQSGEICLKGGHVMMGYWNNPEATKQTIDEDGWLHTGDIGYHDEQGKLYVIDRLKDLIKYKGYQVSPSELEAVLLSHPAVKEVAIIGKPDERCGELPMAFIVKQPDVTISAHEITEFVKRTLSPQKWLHGGVQFIDALPKTSTGKILRRDVRALVSKL